MIDARHRGSVTFWAWALSILIHLIVLLIFGITKFSSLRTTEIQRPIPTAKISQIKKIAETASIIPKPKIKKPNADRLAKTIERTVPVQEIFKTAPQIAQPKQTQAKPLVVSSDNNLTDRQVLSGQVEFFGSFTDQRKICYVVDCSGSMKGIFGQVKAKLKDSIKSLQPDQYFYIIFFGNDKIIESGEGKLIRATRKAKAKAIDFIDNTNAAGKTNAMLALERAVQIKDNLKMAPAVIYFLTDGFELNTEGIKSFSWELSNLLNQNAPSTIINTIGFWPEENDRQMLETIATQSSGEFILVKSD